MNEQNELFEYLKQTKFFDLSFTEKISIINVQTRKHIYRLLLHFDSYASMKREGINYSKSSNKINREEYESYINDYCRTQSSNGEIKELFKTDVELHMSESDLNKWIEDWSEAERRMIKCIVKDVRRTTDPLIKYESEHLNAFNRLMFIICRVYSSVYYVQSMPDLLIPIYKLYMEERNENQQESFISDCECITFRLGSYLYRMMIKYHLRIKGTKINSAIIYEKLFEISDKELFDYCKENKIDCMYYVQEPFTSLYQRLFKYNQLLLLWDRIFCSDRFSYSILFMVTIVIYHRNEIMELKGEDISSFFKCIDHSQYLNLLKLTDELYMKYESNGILQQVIKE